MNGRVSYTTDDGTLLVSWSSDNSRWEVVSNDNTLLWQSSQNVTDVTEVYLWTDVGAGTTLLVVTAEFLTILGVQTALGLSSYANDSAAATGGLNVGDAYIKGGRLRVRMS